jgi:hypothetical protein
LTAGAANATLASIDSEARTAMSEATILHFPRRKMRPDMRANAYAGNDRFLDLACLSMALAQGARQRPVAVNALTPAFLCAGIILGAIDREEFRLE